MAAYAAIISLKHTIKGLVESCGVSTTLEILQLAENETTSLQRVLERFIGWSSSNERLDELEGQIRDCAHELEDVLEGNESNPEDEEASEAISLFVERARELERCYIEELSRQGEEANVHSSYIDFGVKMVGHSRQFNSIRRELHRPMRPVDPFIYLFLGKDGSGRSYAAKTIFEDLRDNNNKFFDCYAWVRVGKLHQLEDVLVSILNQVGTATAGLSGLEQLCNHLNKVLKNRRCMIVLDDLRYFLVMEYLNRWIVYQNNGSVIIVTTNIKGLDEWSTREISFKYAFRVDAWLWFDIRYLVFDENSIPPELEEAGRKIVENCPNSISAAKVLLFLLKSDKTVEEWTKIAADRGNPIFMVRDEIKEVPKGLSTQTSFHLAQL